METLSNLIDKIIEKSIQNYDNTFDLQDNPFEDLISLGELVDRLSMIRETDFEFKSWSSVEDVRLVRERSKLKKCIDEKLIYIISKINRGDESGGFNPEVKKYGK